MEQENKGTEATRENLIKLINTHPAYVTVLDTIIEATKHPGDSEFKYCDLNLYKIGHYEESPFKIDLYNVILHTLEESGIILQINHLPIRRHGNYDDDQLWRLFVSPDQLYLTLTNKKVDNKDADVQPFNWADHIDQHLIVEIDNMLHGVRLTHISPKGNALQLDFGIGSVKKWVIAENVKYIDTLDVGSEQCE